MIIFRNISKQDIHYLMTHNIAFSQVREDPTIEIESINLFLAKFDKINAFVVCSGGCTVLTLLENKIEKLIACDKNPDQVMLAQLKLAFCLYTNDQKTEEKSQLLVSFLEGKETDILDKCKTYLSSSAYDFWTEQPDLLAQGVNRVGRFEVIFRQLASSDFDYETYFSKERLMESFGKSAVYYSVKKPFSDHFKEVLNTYKKITTPDDNYFYHQMINDCYGKSLPYYFSNLSNINKYHKKIDWKTEDIMTALSKQPDESLHLIQTSNITDWIPLEYTLKLLTEIKRCLCPDGIVILRRLNSDINLTETVGKVFTVLKHNLIDKSYFYSEIVIAKNT